MAFANIACPNCKTLNRLAGMMTNGTIYDGTGSFSTSRESSYLLEMNANSMKVAFILCGHCGTPFVARGRDAGSSDVLWPLPIPEIPGALPPKVAEAYRDARLSLSVGSKIGAIMAGRTTLIRLLHDRKAGNLKELVDRHELTPALYGGADQLRLWAGVAGHDDIDVGLFSPEDVQDVLDYLETVLEALYTHQAKVNKLVAKTMQVKAKK